MNNTQFKNKSSKIIGFYAQLNKHLITVGDYRPYEVTDEKFNLLISNNNDVCLIHSSFFGFLWVNKNELEIDGEE